MDTVQQLRERKELAFAKKGLILALLAGMIWSFDGLILDKGLAQEPFSSALLWLFAPLLAAGIHDFSAGCLSLLLNNVAGKRREILRTLCSKPGRLCVMGALLGGPLGMGGYLIGLSLAGAAYVLPITSLYPAIAAVLAAIFLKEKISVRAWCGLALCVAGAIAIGYTPPAGESSGSFLLGIGFAFIAAFGWAAEGVCETSAMDFVEPVLALNIYQFVSTVLYIFIIVPIVIIYLYLSAPDFSAIKTLGAAFSSAGLPFIICAGLVGCMSYRYWYRSMNMTGVSRAMALNITYALWGVIFSAIFTDITITTNLVIGAIIICIGMVLVIGNPRELVNLRNIQ